MKSKEENILEPWWKEAGNFYYGNRHYTYGEFLEFIKKMREDAKNEN